MLLSFLLPPTYHCNPDVPCRWAQVKQRLHDVIEEYDLTFGEPWGQLFKAGLFNSRFGKQVIEKTHMFVKWLSISSAPELTVLIGLSLTLSSYGQVENYACLYTSKVSNLRHAGSAMTGIGAIR